MRKQIKGLVTASCSLGVALLLSGPAWSLAEQAPAEAKPPATPETMTLEELDTVVINARRFEDRLFESEQNFYRRYNELNGQDDLDVNCDVWLSDPAYVGLVADTDRRYCLPRFLARSIALEVYVPATSRSGRGSFGPLPFNTVSNLGSGGALISTPNGLAYTYGSYNWNNSGNSSYPGTSSRKISPQSYLLYLSRRAEFEANLNKVMRGDPQLQVFADRFQALVQERDDTRRVAAQARKLRVALRLEQRKCPLPTSPRSLTKACKSD